MIYMSEWVSLGHPDKMADYVVSNILQHWTEDYDKDVRYAMECLVKGNRIHLAGEITSGARCPTQFNVEQWAREAVAKIGYTKDYACKWPDHFAPCADDMFITLDVTKQSPDIAKGVDKGGWGDQGIFWGLATPDSEHDFMPWDCWLARKIGMELPNYGDFGLDIKTLVEWNRDSDGERIRASVAVPTRNAKDTKLAVKAVSHIVHAATGVNSVIVMVNGTGSFVKHGTMADTGVTGRKLCVDLYGGNCEVGGGCLWGKDFTKADFTLNAYARRLAVDEAVKRGICVKTKLACDIGNSVVTVQIIDALVNRVLYESAVKLKPSYVAHELGDVTYRPADVCAKGLPYAIV